MVLFTQSHKEIMKKTAGITLYITIGRWSRPEITADNVVARICIGFIAIGILFRDIEAFMSCVNDVIQNYKASIEHLEEKNVHSTHTA
jgi:hypothetical protein